jgi:3-oxoacyl-[acyl-carrier protein] reductase
MKQEKKFALVTGASGEIGFSIAHHLINDGWSLYAHYNENKAPIEQLIRSVQSSEIEIIPLKANLAESSETKQLADSIGQIDAFVHAAGFSKVELIQDTKEKTIDDMWQVHMKSLILLSQKLLPSFYQKKQGSIVVISSIWGQTGASCEVVYSTVKGAQIAFVKALSKESARSNIRVNAVAPGMIRTKMNRDFSEDDVTSIEEDIPMGKMGESEDVAQAVRYLLSTESKYITGQTIAINGGWYM